MATENYKKREQKLNLEIKEARKEMQKLQVECDSMAARIKQVGAEIDSLKAAISGMTRQKEKKNYCGYHRTA